MYLTVDGMDQAKFKVPRNLDSSKEFDACWRPQLHLVGALVPGLLEAFYGMNCDVPADSNLTMTVVARTLQHVASVCSLRGVRMPEHFVLLAPHPSRLQRDGDRWRSIEISGDQWSSAHCRVSFTVWGSAAERRRWTTPAKKTRTVSCSASTDGSVASACSKASPLTSSVSGSTDRAFQHGRFRV